MSILVVGAAGYIGSHVVRHLCRTLPENEIIALDNLSQGHRESLSINLIEGDFADSDLLDRIFSENSIDTVIHLAGSIIVSESQSRPFKYFENNCLGPLRLLEAMDRHSVRRMIFSSSGSIYGEPQQHDIDENHPKHPINIYGATKLMIETALEGLHSTGRLQYVTFRYFNAAGADDKGDIGESHSPETHLIPLALSTALGNQEYFSLMGDDYDTEDGTCVRDFVHVNDIAQAHLLALEHFQGSKESFSVNLGSGCGSSVKQVLEVTSIVTGKEISVRNRPRRSGDPARLVADTSLALDKLGWKPSYSLERIIETAWLWMQNKRY